MREFGKTVVTFDLEHALDRKYLKKDPDVTPHVTVSKVILGVANVCCLIMHRPTTLDSRGYARGVFRLKPPIGFLAALLARKDDLLFVGYGVNGDLDALYRLFDQDNAVYTLQFLDVGMYTGEARLYSATSKTGMAFGSLALDFLVTIKGIWSICPALSEAVTPWQNSMLSMYDTDRGLARRLLKCVWLYMMNDGLRPVADFWMVTIARGVLEVGSNMAMWSFFGKLICTLYVGLPNDAKRPNRFLSGDMLWPDFQRFCPIKVGPFCWELATAAEREGYDRRIAFIGNHSMSLANSSIGDIHDRHLEASALAADTVPEPETYDALLNSVDSMCLDGGERVEVDGEIEAIDLLSEVSSDPFGLANLNMSVTPALSVGTPVQDEPDAVMQDSGEIPSVPSCSAALPPIPSVVGFDHHVPGSVLSDIEDWSGVDDDIQVLPQPKKVKSDTVDRDSLLQHWKEQATKLGLRVPLRAGDVEIVREALRSDIGNLRVEMADQVVTLHDVFVKYKDVVLDYSEIHGVSCLRDTSTAKICSFWMVIQAPRVVKEMNAWATCDRLRDLKSDPGSYQAVKDYVASEQRVRLYLTTFGKARADLAAYYGVRASDFHDFCNAYPGAGNVIRTRARSMFGFLNNAVTQKRATQRLVLMVRGADWLLARGQMLESTCRAIHKAVSMWSVVQPGHNRTLYGFWLRTQNKLRSHGWNDPEQPDPAFPGLSKSECASVKLGSLVKMKVKVHKTGAVVEAQVLAAPDPAALPAKKKRVRKRCRNRKPKV